MDFSEIEKIVSKKVFEKKHLKEGIKETEKQLKRLENRLDSALKARIFIQEVAKATQQSLEFRISKLVTHAINSVMPDSDIEFVARIVTRRNKTECDLFFKKCGEEYKPMDGSGFGAVDIASFALRISLWSLRKTAPVFILDEPFRNLSKGYHENASTMVKNLSDRLGIQFIISTHQEDQRVAADKVFRIDMFNRKSTVEVLS
jgi:hypothetical protein